MASLQPAERRPDIRQARSAIDRRHAQIGVGESSVLPANHLDDRERRIQSFSVLTNLFTGPAWAVEFRRNSLVQSNLRRGEEFRSGVEAFRIVRGGGNRNTTDTTQHPALRPRLGSRNALSKYAKNGEFREAVQESTPVSPLKTTRGNFEMRYRGGRHQLTWRCDERNAIILIDAELGLAQRRGNEL